MAGIDHRFLGGVPQGILNPGSEAEVGLLAIMQLGRLRVREEMNAVHGHDRAVGRGKSGKAEAQESDTFRQKEREWMSSAGHEVHAVAMVQTHRGA